MLATAASLKHYDASMLKAVPADPMSSRGIRVANLIMRCTFILYFLLAACGYPLNVEQVIYISLKHYNASTLRTVPAVLADSI